MPNPDLRVALYARVSGEQQAKEDTIASQLEAVERRIASDALECDPELRFVDDGYSGSILARPGLERLRDQAAAGSIDRLYMLDPDRLSRKYAYQVLLLEEFARRKIPVEKGGLTLASTDFGNVSQEVPSDYIGFPVSKDEISGHSHVMREASATDLAHANAMLTAEMLASVAVRIATDRATRDSLGG